MAEIKFEKISLIQAMLKTDTVQFFKTEYGYTFHHVKGFPMLKQSNEDPKLIVDTGKNEILYFEDENHLDKNFKRVDLVTFLINNEDEEIYQVCEKLGVFLGMDVYANESDNS